MWLLADLGLRRGMAGFGMAWPGEAWQGYFTQKGTNDDGITTA
jgi:hypothetical protein